MNKHQFYFAKHKNQFKIKQIAGFVARRIVNHMNPNLDVLKGEK